MVRDLFSVIEAALIVFTAIVAKVAYIDGYLGHSPPLSPYVNVAVLGAVFAHFSLKRQGLYDAATIIEVRGFFPKILVGLGAAFLLLIALGYLLKDAHTYSRGWMLIWFGLGFVGLLTTRNIGRLFLARYVRDGYFHQRIAILGTGPVGERLTQYLIRDVEGVDIVGVFDDRPESHGSSAKLPITGGIDELIMLARLCPIDKIIVALPATAETRITEAVDRLRQLPSEIDLCPDLMSLDLKSPRIDHVGRLSLLEIQPKPMGDWDRISKAVLDYLGSVFVLIVLAPLFAVVAIAIKLDSPGPVFFRQRRHGFNHGVIDVLKFRTMTVMENGPDFRQAQRNDPRATRVGRLLRRTSIDELPQFWNVLRGEMSIVGPRPHAIAHNEQFFRIFQDYAYRHKVKPGITGWAQVNGFRGETNTEEKMRTRVDYDLEYISSWSIWLDLKIILRTIYIVVRATNAH